LVHNKLRANTPGKSFNSNQRALADLAKEAKRTGKSAYYNSDTGRSFTVHNQPGHGNPHVDFTKKRFKKYRPKINLKKE